MPSKIISTFALFILGSLLFIKPIDAQQASPLAGQGIPPPETKNIYVSVFLNRLLDVDPMAYQQTSILYFILSWVDPSAPQRIAENTAAVNNGSTTCSRLCNYNVLSDYKCCDSIYLPTFEFLNAAGFDQNRAVLSEISIGPNNSVIWGNMVAGTYFQPMDFSHFPFEAIDLLTVIKFVDTAPEKNIRIHASAAGPRVYKFAQRGDDSASWNVESVDILQSNATSLVDRMQLFATQRSSPDDPAALVPADGTRSALSDFNLDQTIFVLIKVSRFWRWNLISGVIPIILCGLLGCLVFFQDPGDLGARLSVLVTLFLALTAVQFVIQAYMPESSYVLPIQQCVLTTYIMLAIAAVESILAYTLCHWKAHKAEKMKKKLALQRHKERMQTYKETRRNRSSLSSLPRVSEDSNHAIPHTPHNNSDAGSHGSASGDTASAIPINATPILGGGEKGQTEVVPPKSIRVSVFGRFRMQGRTKRQESSHRKLMHANAKPSIVASLNLDGDYGTALAEQMDWVSLLFLLVGYIASVIAILLSQSGYISLVPR